MCQSVKILPNLVTLQLVTYAIGGPLPKHQNAATSRSIFRILWQFHTILVQDETCCPHGVL